jgi:K+-transporting ATPase ATPase B chain
MSAKQKNTFADQKMFGRAIKDSFIKLSPKTQAENPVMFLVFVSAILTSVLWVVSLFGIKDAPGGFTLAIAIILWFTVLFANFAEAIAEGRGKAQADSLRASRKDVDAHKIPSAEQKDNITVVPSAMLKKGELVIVKAGEQIPADGEVIEGAASVDESAITGESAPVIRESGGDRSAVTGGTTVTSDWLIIRVTVEAGKSFLDKMIAMVEGASRKKTPNEIALQILLITLTIIFLAVSACLLPYSKFAIIINPGTNAEPVSITNIIALLVCLAPTTIGALLSSIGIAGMARLNKANVLAMSGRAIEAAGDVDVLLLDKTGTITLGNRQASEFIPLSGISERDLAEAAQLSSIADETAEGRSIVVLAKNKFALRSRELAKLNARFIAFSAKTRMSGVDIGQEHIRKGSADAIQNYVESQGGIYPEECRTAVERVAGAGGTPLVVARNDKVLGVIYLKDIVKEGVKEKFSDLRKIGIKTIMITGDNPVTAAAIAAEAGVDDFVAEATPETKLALIKKMQQEGHLVAMTGDGTNDAPALAQADVAVAMNSGTQAAKEAGNMVDLDSSPTKLIEVVRIGKQLLMTRGALTTFSIANDVAKYFAIIPALFAAIYPNLDVLNFMRLGNAMTAMLSAIIYNALIIVALIPLSLRGVKYKEQPAGKMLKNNLLIYGLGGIIAPFIFIKLFDMILCACFGLPVW